MEVPEVGSFAGVEGSNEPRSAVVPYSTWLLASSLVVQVIVAVVLAVEIGTTFEISSSVVVVLAEGTVVVGVVVLLLENRPASSSPK